MSGRGAIRLGDQHSGGESMVEANGFPVNGILQYLLGDKATCPTHKGNFLLVSGGDRTAKGQGEPCAVSATPALTMCVYFP